MTRKASDKIWHLQKGEGFYTPINEDIVAWAFAGHERDTHGQIGRMVRENLGNCQKCVFGVSSLYGTFGAEAVKCWTWRRRIGMIKSCSLLMVKWGQRLRGCWRDLTGRVARNDPRGSGCRRRIRCHLVPDVSRIYYAQESWDQVTSGGT